ncbi:hypothetical protein BaRGS_00001064 [Batillaria attramentaria]|uniref:WW domain-containing protein n=1 Tax=Batillaria attramentaria TaxID=370345 RepID=A0ABD0M6W3_9CAEN
MQHQQKGYGGMYGDRSPAEGSHGHSTRGDSPGSRPSPRYQNKPPYIERNKEKRGSLSLAEKKVNQYLATGSIGQNAPGPLPSHRDHRERERDHRQEGNGDNSHHGQDKASSSKRDPKDGKDRDHRVEVQKSAVRVCGDWSEHISSSGKRYYYNCKTEVSQWEKPKEWSDSAKPPDRPKDGRGSGRPSSSSTHARGGDERARHSSVGERHDARYRPESSSSASADKQSQKLSERSKSYSMDAPNSSTAPATAGSNSQRSSTVQRSNSAVEGTHNHAGYSSHGGHAGHSTHAGHTSHPELKRNSVYHGASSGEPARRRSRHESDSSRGVMGHATNRNDDGGQAEDMDISPGSTPTSSRPSSCTGTPQMPPNSTPAYAHPGNSMPHASPSVASSSSQHLATSVASLLNTSQGSDVDLNRKAIETLQELQKALSLHIKAQQSKDEGIRLDRDRDGRESPASDMSPRSSCRSPTPSTGSSQHAHTIGTSALSVAALKSQQSVNLTPSLSNYYNEKLIGHVLGWQAEYLERQAERFRHESLALGSLHCSRVSVEQKKSRSLVRTAEIQSTIYEQRIMVLQQQRAEIENLKPPTSLLPS